MKKQKGFAQIILILVLLAVVAGGAYYLGTKKISPVVPTPTPVVTSQPTPSTIATPNPMDETANWKTYSDPYLSFKYPPNFTVSLKTGDNYQGFHNETITSNQFTFTTGKMLPNGGNSTIQDFSGFSVNIGPTNGMTLKQYYAGQKGMSNAPIEITKINPDGNAIEAATLSNVQIYKVERSGNNFYYISPFQNAAVLPDGSDEIRNYMDQIISTFKFL